MATIIESDRCQSVSELYRLSEFDTMDHHTFVINIGRVLDGIQTSADRSYLLSICGYIEHRRSLIVAENLLTRHQYINFTSMIRRLRTKIRSESINKFQHNIEKTEEEFTEKIYLLEYAEKMLDDTIETIKRFAI